MYLFPSLLNKVKEWLLHNFLFLSCISNSPSEKTPTTGFNFYTAGCNFLSPLYINCSLIKAAVGYRGQKIDMFGTICILFLKGGSNVESRLTPSNMVIFVFRTIWKIKSWNMGKNKKKVEKTEKIRQKINIWQPPILYCPSDVFMIL